MNDQLSLIAHCAGLYLRWQLGDTDPLGIALTAGYILVLALMLWRLVAPPAGWPALPRGRQLWIVATMVFAALTLNKQLDLQHQAQHIGHCVAEAQGWYKTRAGFEHAVARTLLAATVLATMALLVWFRGVLRANWPLIAGFVLLTLYILLQMSDALHLDQVLRGVVDFVPLHRAIEAAALIVLAFAAWPARAR